MLSVCSIHSRQILDPSRFLGSFSIDSRHISRYIEVILCALCQLDSSWTASQSVETLSHALFFTCFASFYYLSQHLVTLHSSFYMDSLCPFNHLYISRVKFYNFLYPLSIMTKRERKCGFFLRFYMLRGEIHAFVRGSCVSSCQGECLPPCCFRSFFQLLVHWSCDYFYIHCVYL